MIDGKALKRARQAAQLTQAGLARAVGMAAQQLAATEQGRVKTTKFLAALARALNVPLGELDPDWAAFDPPRPAVARARRDKARDERLAEDYAAFAAATLRIRSKSGTTLPLVFNCAQQHIHERLEAQRQNLGRVRALVLKGRQQGCSTYIAGRFYHRTIRGRGLRAFILTHETRATQNLFEMIERFHANCPEAERPLTGASNAEELWFSALDSGFKVGTAGTRGVGRSATLQLFHGSEVAFWPFAETHAAGVLQAVPNEAATEIILESTANGVGNFFHKKWREAETGKSEYIAIFVPWYWQDEYRIPAGRGFKLDAEEGEYSALYALEPDQMAWRRVKIAELGDALLFKQEYPATAAEAFQMSGHDSYLPAMLVPQPRKREYAHAREPWCVP
jgi:transcriptional regulator with XRE-family HTH domain